MAGNGSLVHWQAKLGMTLVGVGSIGLFSITKSWAPLTGNMSSYIFIVMALLGMLMLMLSMGIDSDSEELNQPFTMMEEEKKVLDIEEGE